MQCLRHIAYTGSITMPIRILNFLDFLISVGERRLEEKSSWAGLKTNSCQGYGKRAMNTAFKFRHIPSVRSSNYNVHFCPSFL